MTEPEIRDALRRIVDPELGMNIVDLGLVYAVRIDGSRVSIDMTMTTPACPLGSYLTGEVEETIRLRMPEASHVQVSIVWEPRWHPGMMSSAARMQMGWGEGGEIR